MSRSVKSAVIHLSFFKKNLIEFSIGAPEDTFTLGSKKELTNTISTFDYVPSMNDNQTEIRCEGNHVSLESPMTHTITLSFDVG